MMDEEKNAVPYIVHEGVLARMERQLRRQFITIIILIVALILSNSVWLYSFMQYDYSSEMIMASQDGRGINIVGGGDGEGNSYRYYPRRMSYARGRGRNARRDAMGAIQPGRWLFLRRGRYGAGAS